MIAIKGGTVVRKAGDIIENGIVLIDGDKITAVGSIIDIPAGARVINAAGKWVTPGFIDAHTHLATANEPWTMPHLPTANDIDRKSTR